MITKFEVLAIYAFVLNLKDGMDVNSAKGDAIFLAKVANSGASGWSGKRKTNMWAPQVISSKVYVRNGEIRDSRVFGGRIMNEKAFDQQVVEKLGIDVFSRILARIETAVQRGVEYSEVCKFLIVDVSRL